jgi:hypothetical protein
MHRMPLIPPDERLSDLDFLALVKASLEEYAPGVTLGAELKGSSLISPRGWAVAVAPPQHGSGQHYDLVALPDVNVQPDVPCFMDCVVAISGNARYAADAWVQTAGACLLELLDRREHFADHAGPFHTRGIPGWHVIASGAVGLGLDAAESQRLQTALVNANVLHHIAATHGANCGCGEHLDPEHPGFDLPLPHLIAELPDDERDRRVRVDTGVIMIAEDVGNFLKVRLPVQLEDGRTVVYLVWIYLEASALDEFVKRVHSKTWKVIASRDCYATPSGRGATSCCARQSFSAAKGSTRTDPSVTAM